MHTSLSRLVMLLAFLGTPSQCWLLAQTSKTSHAHAVRMRIHCRRDPVTPLNKPDLFAWKLFTYVNGPAGAVDVYFGGADLHHE